MMHESTLHAETAQYLFRDRSVPEGAEAVREAGALAVCEHPVFAVLDGMTQDLLIETGCEKELQTGDPLMMDDDVIFIVDGMIGTLGSDMDVCVAVAGAGGVLGLERSVSSATPARTLALSDSTVFAAPSSTMIDALGRTRVTDLCLRHTLARLQAMQQEAACNASHLVPQRLAKWLMRLHRANGGRDIHITQAELARLIGVQRTSVNAAAKQLQMIGAARFIRGRISVQDMQKLSDSSCGCSV